MKKLRFSTFAQVLTVLLCAAMIWVGLYVLDSRANVVWDLTPDLLTELSEGTIQTMDGLDESGPCTAVFAEAEVKRAMTRSAHQKILLCDSTKLERTAPVAFCGWPDIDLLITDSAIDGALAEKIQTRVPLIIAGDQ